MFSQSQGFQQQLQSGQSSGADFGMFQSTTTYQQAAATSTTVASSSQSFFMQPLNNQFQQQPEFGAFQSTATPQQPLVDNATSNVTVSSSQSLFSQSQFQQQFFVQSEFGVFQSTATHQQPLVDTATNNTAASYSQPLHNLPITNTTPYASTQLASSQVVSTDDEFGMFQSNNDHTVLSTKSPPQANNSNSFGHFEAFQSATNEAPISSSNVQQQTTDVPNVVASAIMPYWKRSFHYIPSLYHDVFVLCETGDGQFLDTSRLFPVLSSSGLQRPLLRDIWTSVNKVQAGKLTREELFQALGLIALAQVRYVMH